MTTFAHFFTQKLWIKQFGNCKLVKNFNHEEHEDKGILFLTGLTGLTGYWGKRKRGGGRRGRNGKCEMKNVKLWGIYENTGYSC